MNDHSISRSCLTESNLWVPVAAVPPQILPPARMRARRQANGGRTLLIKTLERALGPVVVGVCLAAGVSGLHGAGPGDAADWRLGVAAWSFNRFTLFEAVDKAAAMGIPCVEAFEGQRLSPEGPATVNAELSDEQIAGLRAKLRKAGVELPSIYIHNLPGDEAASRRLFAFARRLGVGTIVSEPAPEALDLIERLADEYRIDVALHNHPQGSSRYWHPDEVMKACEGRGPRIGACADVGHWQRSGIQPADGVRRLGSRLLSLHVKDLDQAGPQGHDVPWGTGQGNIAGLLRAVRDSGARPRLFAIEYEYNWENNTNEIAQCAAYFRRTVSELSNSSKPQPERN